MFLIFFVLVLLLTFLASKQDHLLLALLLLSQHIIVPIALLDLLVIILAVLVRDLLCRTFLLLLPLLLLLILILVRMIHLVVMAMSVKLPEFGFEPCKFFADLSKVTTILEAARSKDSRLLGGRRLFGFRLLLLILLVVFVKVVMAMGTKLPELKVCRIEVLDVVLLGVSCLLLIIKKRNDFRMTRRIGGGDGCQKERSRRVNRGRYEQYWNPGR
ncbi:hypothetical protein EDD21DRAFT_390000 [Dissophora ornata]|nr:hypothetical protein EDD21DRAFT_390000 [Dissophora ornata]